MNKTALILIILFVLIGFVSAIKLGITPSEVYFNGYLNEKICKNITIFSDFNGDISGEIKWTKVKDSKILKDYNIISEDLNINSDYPKRIEVFSRNKKELITVCLSGEKPGRYYGALLYGAEESHAGVGSWIYLRISKDNKTEGKLIGFGSLSIISLFLVLIILFFIDKKLLTKYSFK
jgi:hypothetical protein